MTQNDSHGRRGPDSRLKKVARPRLTGTFLNPHERYVGWTDADWRREIEAMRAVGLDTVILGWTMQDGLAVSPGESLELVDDVMRAAGSGGMRVFLGLANETRYWGWNPGACYRQVRKDSVRIAERLLALYASHPSLAGWYLTPEIDDLRWNLEGSRRRLVGEYLRPVTEWLHQRDGRPVLVSPFFFRWRRPAAFGRWWKTTLSECQIDVVALQDGVGCGRVTAPQVSAYLAALREATIQTGVALWANVELFTQIRAWPPWRFAAIPARCERVLAQMAVAAPHAERLICFEFATYMSPHRGAAQARLYLDYAHATSR